MKDLSTTIEKLLSKDEPAITPPAPTQVKATQAIIDKMPDMVRGAGYRKIGGVEPTKAGSKRLYQDVREATLSMYKSVVDGRNRALRGDLTKSLSPGFAAEFPMFFGGQMGNQAQWNQQVQQVLGMMNPDIMRNFTTTSPLSSGLVPFDLLAPTRLIYPIFSPSQPARAA